MSAALVSPSAHGLVADPGPGETSPQPPGPSPLVHALRGIALDFLTTLVFLSVSAASGDPVLAGVAAFVAGVVEIVWLLARGRRPDALQWGGLLLVAGLGLLALATRSPRLLLFKPVLIYAGLGLLMLRPGWMNRYVPPRAKALIPDLTHAFGYVWAGLMLATAALGAALVFQGSVREFAVFFAVLPPASKIVLFGVQYAWSRSLAVRRARRGAIVSPMVNAPGAN